MAANEFVSAKLKANNHRCVSVMEGKGGDSKGHISDMQYFWMGKNFSGESYLK